MGSLLQELLREVALGALAIDGSRRGAVPQPRGLTGDLRAIARVLCLALFPHVALGLLARVERSLLREEHQRQHP